MTEETLHPQSSITYTFIEKLEQHWQYSKFVCVGLDPEYSRLPETVKSSHSIEDALFVFAHDIVDATHDLICAYKPNVAFYEALGDSGLQALTRTVRYLKECYPHIPIILDAKRGDIGIKAGPLEGPAEAGEFVERQPREQAVVMEGFPGAVLDAPDYYAGEVIDELFSGMASRLFERVRDQKGLAYFVRWRDRQPQRRRILLHGRNQPGKEAWLAIVVSAIIYALLAWQSLGQLISVYLWLARRRQC